MGEAVGRSGKPFRLTSGLSTVNNLPTIRQTVVEIRPERTMEIGGSPRAIVGPGVAQIVQGGLRSSWFTLMAHTDSRKSSTTSTLD
jgi:hypothetical protein